MTGWNRDLVAFIHDEPGFSYGTREPDEYKVMTPEGSTGIRKDAEWANLLRLIEVFSS